MSKNIKYFFNNQEVTQEEFRANAQDKELFKWFNSDGVNAVDFSSAEKHFDGNYQSNESIYSLLQDQLMNEEEYRQKHIKDLRAQEKEAHQHLRNAEQALRQEGSFAGYKKCSDQCYCDGSCKEPKKNMFDSAINSLKKEEKLPEYKTVGISFEDLVRSIVGDLEPDKKETEECIPWTNLIRGRIFAYEPQEDSELTPEELNSWILNPNLEVNKSRRKEWVEDDSKVGVKHNKNKLPMSKLFIQFPDALQAVVLASCYGHHRYPTDIDWLNFKRVEGGSQAYKDAEIRHFLGGENDVDSGLPEIFHQAWNKIAELQLWIEENDLNIKDFSENYMKSLHNQK